jgi:nucleotidyltransferase substrate binding protein (TIGR01987 family)
MKLDLSALEMAIASLGKASTRAKGTPGDEELRDAVIQRFEYTYELCWKMVKRRIETDAAVPSDVDAMSFPVLMREAAERGLVLDVMRWLEYREQRNITSHTYNAAKAQSVFETTQPFLEDARALLSELQRRNDD